MNKKLHWFTLVELVVVVMILAILSTLAFVSYNWYSSQARDSKRMSDIKSLQWALEFQYIKNYSYPNPDNYQNISYSWTVLWKQGTFWENALQSIVSQIDEIPKDPKYDNEYVYSVSADNQYYQFMYISEQEDLVHHQFLQSVYTKVKNIIVKWNYNNIVLRMWNYIIPTPSIITSETLPMELSASTIGSQVITWAQNIPDMWVSKITPATSQLSFPNFWVYDWNVSSKSQEADLVNVYDTIANTYSGTTLWDSDIIQSFLSGDSQSEKVNKIQVYVFEKPTSTIIVQEQTTPPVSWGICSAWWTIPCTAN